MQENIQRDHWAVFGHPNTPLNLTPQRPEANTKESTEAAHGTFKQLSGEKVPHSKAGAGRQSPKHAKGPGPYLHLCRPHRRQRRTARQPGHRRLRDGAAAARPNPMRVGGRCGQGRSEPRSDPRPGGAGTAPAPAGGNRGAAEAAGRPPLPRPGFPREGVEGGSRPLPPPGQGSRGSPTGDARPAPPLCCPQHQAGTAASPRPPPHRAPVGPFPSRAGTRRPGSPPAAAPAGRDAPGCRSPPTAISPFAGAAGSARRMQRRREREAAAGRRARGNSWRGKRLAGGAARAPRQAAAAATARHPRAPRRGGGARADRQPTAPLPPPGAGPKGDRRRHCPTRARGRRGCA
ncbi:basic salivary proline-rich protein 2-like [Corvus cornix cornix]|uniref:basic salivary proline-rich protein 2-like n=1 Tax=Corvus cornix cornix TaxID=932674 RepID=UPI0019516ECD|nr:basic salivary proline-rich protein 2-like [Corvus cornix cornix]